MKKIFLKNLIIVFLFFVLALIIIWRILFFIDFKARGGTVFGVTFSQKQAEMLQLSWKEVYQSILNDLKPKNLRLVAYWDLVEPREGEYDFSDLDWQMNEAASHNAKVILIIGRRVPRWPECHVPPWANLSYNQQNDELLNYLKVTIEHFRNHPALKMWQVENEPFLEIFGQCPPRDKAMLIKEIALVKSLDPNHPVMVTDSGELATWLRTRNLAEYLGTSAYRVVYNPWVGYVNYGYLIPPAYYRIKARLIGKPADKIIVSEMQMEPWTPQDLINTPLKEQFKSINLDKFQANISFAQHLGFSEVYLWGVEWWYWIKDKGYPQYWNEAKKLF